MDKKVILLVEDDVALRTLVAGKLLDAGYEVLEAGDGQAGYDIFMNYLPNLMVVDVLLPKMNGDQLVENIRATDIGKKTPIIITTVRILMKDYFEDLHVEKFMGKPFEIQELLDAIKEILCKLELDERFRSELERLRKTRPGKKGRTEEKREHKECEHCQSSARLDDIRCPSCGSVRLRIVGAGEEKKKAIPLKEQVPKEEGNKTQEAPEEKKETAPQSLAQEVSKEDEYKTRETKKKKIRRVFSSADQVKILIGIILSIVFMFIPLDLYLGESVLHFAPPVVGLFFIVLIVTLKEETSEQDSESDDNF